MSHSEMEGNNPEARERRTEVSFTQEQLRALRVAVHAALDISKREIEEQTRAEMTTLEEVEDFNSLIEHDRALHDVLALLN
jgi:hypothetical protein